MVPINGRGIMKFPAPINAINRSLIDRKHDLENSGYTKDQIERNNVIIQCRKAIEILEEANE